MPLMMALRKPTLAALAVSFQAGFRPAQAPQQPGGTVRPDAVSDDLSTAAVADGSATDLAEKLQNPISDTIGVPFQSNSNFSIGANKGTQDILNIQPVIPRSVWFRGEASPDMERIDGRP
jgi:hypothetical protein